MRRFTLLWVAFVVGACSGPSPSSDPLAFCLEVVGRVCDQQISCNLVAQSHRAECAENLKALYCRVRSNEASRGLYKMNAKLTTKCLTDVARTGCTREAAALDFACLAAIEPAVEPAGKCEEDSECRNPTNRCIGSGCDRTCQAAGAAGQPCRPSGAGTGTCDSGLVCDVSGLCSAGGATNADCSGGLSCDGNNFCDATTRKCAALPTTGQPCRNGFQCDEASMCSIGMCIARVAAGGGCLTSQQCVVGTACRNLTCQAQVAENGTCATSADCATGLNCDSVSLTCLTNTRAFFEESCSSTRVCNGGLTCRNLKPATAGTPGTAGSCGQAAAGDTCFSSASCPPATTCEPSTTAGQPGTCKASASGATCSAVSDCLESEACDAVDRKCVARVAAGGNCANVACVATATCVRRGAAQVCVEPADLGKTCNGDMVATTPCRAPLLCDRTTCISVGRKSEPCLGGSFCFYGFCDNGICVDPRPNGAVCKLDPDCRSGACDRGICVEVCR